MTTDVVGTGYGSRTHYLRPDSRRVDRYGNEQARALCSPGIWLTFFSDKHDDASLRTRPLCKVCIKRKKKDEATQP